MKKIKKNTITPEVLFSFRPLIVSERAVGKHTWIRIFLSKADFRSKLGSSQTQLGHKIGPSSYSEEL